MNQWKKLQLICAAAFFVKFSNRLTVRLITVKSFTVSRIEGRLFPFYIEVGDVSKSADAKRGYAFSSFLRHYRSHRGRRRTESVPERHRRNAGQMAKQHTLQSKVAEKCKRVPVCLFHPVNIAFS